MRRVRALGLGITITAVAVSACSTTGGHGQPTGPAVTVTGIHTSDDRTTMALDIEVANSSDRTVYAYETVRNVQYDPPNRALQITLADTQPAEPTRGSFVLPQFVAINAGTHHTIHVTLPRTMTHLAAGTAGSSAATEPLPISDASTVEVRVAWGDTPF